MQGFTGFFPSLVVVVTGFAVVTTVDVVVVAGVAGFVGKVPGIVSQLGVEVVGVVGLVVTVVEEDRVVGLVVVVVVEATSYLSSFSKLTGFTLKIKRTFPSAEVVKSAFALFTL